MNFTPVLDELLIGKIARGTMRNTELDQFHSPINSTASLNGGVVSAFFPPLLVGPGRRGPERFWASCRYEQSIDRVDERCQIDRSPRGDDLAVGDRGFIDEGRAGIFQVRLDAPPAGGALAAS